METELLAPPMLKLFMENSGKIFAIGEGFQASPTTHVKEVDPTIFDPATLGRAFVDKQITTVTNEDGTTSDVLTWGDVIIYDPLIFDAPSTSTIGTVFTATATLPTGSTDAEVVFSIGWQDEAGEWSRTDPIAVAVVDGKASNDFSFSTSGEYVIDACSEHHGLIQSKVVVS
jgi:hypothetical protein